MNSTKKSDVRETHISHSETCEGVVASLTHGEEGFSNWRFADCWRQKKIFGFQPSLMQLKRSNKKHLTYTDWQFSKSDWEFTKLAYSLTDITDMLTENEIVFEGEKEQSSPGEVLLVAVGQLRGVQG